MAGLSDNCRTLTIVARWKAREQKVVFVVVVVETHLIHKSYRKLARFLYFVWRDAFIFRDWPLPLLYFIVKQKNYISFGPCPIRNCTKSSLPHCHRNKKHFCVKENNEPVYNNEEWQFEWSSIHHLIRKKNAKPSLRNTHTVRMAMRQIQPQIIAIVWKKKKLSKKRNKRLEKWHKIKSHFSQDANFCHTILLTT